MEASKIDCLGFIMDGNRRWAKAQGKPTLEGHRKGSDTLVEIARYMRDAGIPHAVFYAFSTENWKRSTEEVEYLMDLFAEFLDKAEEKFDENKEKRVHVKIAGRVEDFPEKIQQRIEELKKKEETIEADTTIWIALSYGGRAEIVEAVNAAIKNGEPVTEESFEQLLWTADMPDPDLIIRTSGEQRLSNFMTWKSVYSELFFTDTYWPDFDAAELQSILSAYNERQRRKGV